MKIKNIKVMNTQTAKSQAALSPKEALTLLEEGNKRFINNSTADRDLLKQVNETSHGQYPFAVVLSCIDSRVPAEIVFDQGVGDIFSARIAGNFVNEDILGSLEFACKAAGSKLIVVLGHTSCGAVKGACDHVELGNLTGMLKKLKPAIDAVSTDGERSSKNAEYVQKVADKNVELTIQQIKEKSPVLKEMLDDGTIGIAGGMYDVTSGKVKFSQRP
ncbi:carbonic anhydrase family protein [Marivirga sp.]|uniref:carbonic anhydrase family protein n=1 Tax=Marivirga sp. TaxID=2018662 RepID=UPI002D8089F3|nr:carbonic anhydrase family protein [Marivirga sp.]HET8859367.1 carbonic anhydrase family protein [Marivirga sp.]